MKNNKVLKQLIEDLLHPFGDENGHLPTISEQKTNPLNDEMFTEYTVSIDYKDLIGNNFFSKMTSLKEIIKYIEKTYGIFLIEEKTISPFETYYKHDYCSLSFDLKIK